MIWTPPGSAYSIDSSDVPDLAAAWIQARSINPSVTWQTVIDTFTTGQRLQELSNYDLLTVLSGSAVGTCSASAMPIGTSTASR